MPRKKSNNLPQTYASWVSELKKRYAQSQIKAFIAVNGELIGFYYSLGRDIQQKQFQNTYGSGFYKKLFVRSIGKVRAVARVLLSSLRYNLSLLVTLERQMQQAHCAQSA